MLRNIRVVLTFLALGGYILFDYGFTNLFLRIGYIPLPVGYILAYSALVLILVEKYREILSMLRQPLFLAWIGLGIISAFHLAYDIPRFGLYAIRDASFVLEGAFLALGFLWAKDGKDSELFIKILMIVLVLNLLYSFAYPFSATLTAITPIQGAFQKVSFLGTYAHFGLFLVTGAALFLWLSALMTGWKKISLIVLAVIQAGWSFVFQARTMYIGIILIIFLALIYAGWKKAARTAAMYAGGFMTFIVIIFLFNSIGQSVQGRVGTVNLLFYIQHAESILPTSSQPTNSPTEAGIALAQGNVPWRYMVWGQAIQHWLATPFTIAAGEGFGKPLSDRMMPPAGNIAIRQPHNIFLTVLARLGLLGFLIFSFVVINTSLLFHRSLRIIEHDSESQQITLWLMAFFGVGLVMAFFQPWLEFSYGAVPFFTIIGFSIAYINRINPQKQ